MLEYLKGRFSDRAPSSWSLRQKIDSALSALNQIQQAQVAWAPRAQNERSLVLQAQLLVLGEYITGEPRLDVASETIVKALISSLKPLKIGESLSPEAIGAVLDQIRAILQTRRTLTEEFSPQTGSLEPQINGSMRTINQEDTQNSMVLKPNESAILWATTEKLYASWPVRSLGVLIVAAVFLAGTGTVLIGDQSIKLRENLAKTATDANTQLQQLGSSTRANLEDQSKSLASELERRRNEMRQSLASVDQQIKDLESKSSDVEARAVQAVSQNILTDIQGVKNQLRDTVTQDLARIRDTDVPAAQKQLASLRSSIDSLSSSVTAANAELDTSKPDIQRLIQYTREADKIDQAVGAVREAGASASEASVNASGALQSARQSVANIDRLGQDVSKKIEPLSQEIGVHQHELGVIQERLHALTVSLDQASVGIKSLTDQIKADADSLKPVDKHVAELQRAAGSTGEQSNPSPSPPRHLITEDELTRDQWRLIQRKLAEVGPRHGRFDGVPGPQTEDGIRKFQRKLGATVTGHLTPDEINTLLYPQSEETKSSP